MTYFILPLHFSKITRCLQADVMGQNHSPSNLYLDLLEVFLSTKINRGLYNAD